MQPSIAANAGSGEHVVPFSTQPPGPLPEAWKPLPFRGVPPSSYALARDGETTVVRSEADASASGLAFRFRSPVSPAATLRWRWKAARLPERGDTRVKASDDAVARVYVTFVAPPRQPAIDRMREAAVRMLYGEPAPYATLLYVWDTSAPAGAVFVNAYAESVRNVVVESGPARVGRWVAYERDVAADYRRAFGEDPPLIGGVAIMTDADNTKTKASASYGDIALEAR